MRRLINCSSCGKNNKNYGLGMCSACLRKHKRRTRPGFYLGTCYSEMSRRTKTTKHNSSDNYFCLGLCSKETFFNHFLADPTFLELYKGWQESGFQRKYAPSIDRIDPSKGYVVGNMQFLRQGRNSCKDKEMTVSVYELDGCLVGNFKSQAAAAETLGLQKSSVCLVVNGIRPSTCGYIIKGDK